MKQNGTIILFRQQVNVSFDDEQMSVEAFLSSMPTLRCLRYRSVWCIDHACELLHRNESSNNDPLDVSLRPVRPLDIRFSCVSHRSCTACTIACEYRITYKLSLYFVMLLRDISPVVPVVICATCRAVRGCLHAIVSHIITDVVINDDCSGFLHGPILSTVSSSCGRSNCAEMFRYLT
jgi:hypothetical protein